MAREFSRARIGVFVLLSTAMLLSAIIWLGSQQVFKKYSEYYTYFNESVSGLDVSASVKYRGVFVGRVADIFIDPDDSSRIMVRMELRPGTPVKTDMVAKLGMTGITGIKYIELSGGSKEAELLEPGTPRRRAVIPSEATLLAKVDQQFEQLYEQLAGVVQNLRELTGSESQARFQGALDGFTELSTSLADTLKQLQPELSRIAELERHTEALLAATRQEIQLLGESARANMGQLTDTITNSPLPQTLNRLDQTAEQLLAFSTTLNQQLTEMNPAGLGRDLRSAVNGVEEAANGIKQLVDELKRNPSSIVFSQPRPERDTRQQPSSGR